MHIPDFTSIEVWISILTLSFLEVVLGVDNVIFVSIVANQLPKNQQKRARNIGLMLALGIRLLLLLAIGFIISLTKPLFTVPFRNDVLAMSTKDIILMLGGLFLLYKSTIEIHHKFEGTGEEMKTKKTSGYIGVIIQICLVNLVFSFDSILTAIGLTQDVFIMMVGVIISIIVMMLFSEAVSHFINTHPTMQMLALSFLILIGAMLVMEAFHQEVSKGYIYFAIAFSLGVEILNLRLRRRQKAHKDS